MNLEHFGRRLLEDMPDALIVADADGIIRFWNAGAERIFGFASAEALGRSLDLITPENLRARHWDGYRRTMQTGETKYAAGDLLSVPAIRKDGRRISVQFSILPLKAAGGGLEGHRHYHARRHRKLRRAQAAEAGAEPSGALIVQPPQDRSSRCSSCPWLCGRSASPGSDPR